MDVDMLALRRQNVIRILVALCNPNLFETRVVKADAFLVLQGYSFCFTKEMADFAVEKDFVPFIWRRNEKDDDAKGMEEKGNAASMNEAPKSEDGDTPMTQANASGPGGATLGLLGSTVPPLAIAVTPFNKNPQTPRGKELVAEHLSRQLLVSSQEEEVRPGLDGFQPKEMGLQTSPRACHSAWHSPSACLVGQRGVAYELGATSSNPSPMMLARTTPGGTDYGRREVCWGYTTRGYT